jgi:hypothetical protein
MNETDRELLLWAAKAAGYKKYYAHYLGRDSFVTYDEEYYSEVKEGRVVGEKTLDWNPLTDDGDALRLAVKCGFFSYEIIPEELSSAFLQSDPYAATRRAIVRAAAEIGRNMP